MSTALQSSERPLGSEIPCRISRTGFVTIMRYLQDQQRWCRFRDDSEGTSWVGITQDARQEGYDRGSCSRLGLDVK
jgi:hypothetical protein